MPNFNQVILMGNLTIAPEVRYTPKGTAVGGFSIAVNDSFKAADGTIKEQVTYVEIEVWGRLAETCKQYLGKGKPVHIDGQLKLDQWEQDGHKRSKLKVRANRVQFLGQGSGKSDSNSAQSKSEEPPIPDGEDISF